jgi:hypothetical protein
MPKHRHFPKILTEKQRDKIGDNIFIEVGIAVFIHLENQLKATIISCTLQLTCFKVLKVL